MLCSSLCSYIIFKNFSLVIFIESFFFSKLGSNQFILINITDLFDIIWYICLKNAFFLSSLYFGYSVFYFFKPGWYEYQTFFETKLFQNFVWIWFIYLLIFYFYFLPLVLKFLTHWDINYWEDLFYIKFELSLLNYVKWLFYIKFYFIFVFHFIYILIFWVYFLLELKMSYFILKKNKKQIFYVILCCLFFLSPPDLSLQIFLLIVTIFLTEIIYFFLCFKILYINIYNYANNTTTIKKFSKIKNKKK
uniref:Sec-independent protein translocase component TatC n=1 Tax=Hypnea marchantiae TaxID=3024792 RepID=UPI00300149C2|nr:Sec-independent protein translocase component TatC [Hypnea marchantiae]